MLGLGQSLVGYDIPVRNQLVLNGFQQNDTNDENLALIFIVTDTDTKEFIKSRPNYGTSSGDIVEGVTADVTAINNTTSTTGTATFQIFRYHPVLDSWYFLAPDTSSFVAGFDFQRIDLTSDFSSDLSANADPNSYDFSLTIKTDSEIWEDSNTLRLESIGIDQA